MVITIATTSRGASLPNSTSASSRLSLGHDRGRKDERRVTRVVDADVGIIVDV